MRLTQVSVKLFFDNGGVVTAWDDAAFPLLVVQPADVTVEGMVL